MGVVIVNYQWLVDFYFGLARTVDSAQDENCELISAVINEVNVTPYIIECYSEVCEWILRMCLFSY